jgi:hypothetical protein
MPHPDIEWNRFLLDFWSKQRAGNIRIVRVYPVLEKDLGREELIRFETKQFLYAAADCQHRQSFRQGYAEGGFDYRSGHLVLLPNISGWHDVAEYITMK